MPTTEPEIWEALEATDLVERKRYKQGAELLATTPPEATISGEGRLTAPSTPPAGQTPAGSFCKKGR